VRWSRRRRIIEDLLKWLFDREAFGRPSEPAELAGHFGWSSARAQREIQQLRELGHVEPKSLRLTPKGRALGERIARTHRLVETYLAQETDLDPREWHRRAHAAEHKLTLEEADALAQSLGEPVYDPHGDPIPTAEALGVELPKCKSLLDCPAGWVGRIAHIEDEPETLFRALAGKGFAPDMQFRVTRAAPDRIEIESEGRRIELSREEAGQIGVRELGPHEVYDPTIRRLSDLPLGAKARVVGLSPRVRGVARDRLLQLGFVRNSLVEVELENPSGDPVAYRVRGALIALRRSQAADILVRRVAEGSS
jgi:DtxR family Mn-dependent transcriptional regulator